MNQAPYYLMVTFWGERFREFFYSLCLSSLLSPNNLPALRNRPGCKFLIATSQDDWLALQGRPLFERMRQYVEPTLIDIGYPGEDDQPILHMSKGHRRTARLAVEHRAWAGFFAPDLLVSDGAIRFVIEKAMMGKQAVLAPALRYSMEPVTEFLAREGYLKPDQPLVLRPRLLGDLACRSLHSEIGRYEFDAPYFGDYPIWSYWRVPGRRGIVLHTVSWALLLGKFGGVREYTDSILENNTIDADYVYQNFYRGNTPDDLYLASDSDDLLFMSLTPESELTFLPFRDRPINSMGGGNQDRLYNMRTFLFSPDVDPFRRWAYRTPCQIHADDLTEASFETAGKSVAIVERAIGMGPVDRLVHRLYMNALGRQLGKLDPYPRNLAELILAVDGRGVRGGIATRIMQSKLREARSRVRHAVLTRMVDPLLGRLDARSLRVTMNLVPRRYARKVVKRARRSRMFRTKKPGIWPRTERRILRAVLGRAIGPALGRLDRRLLRRTLNLVPKRYLRPVLRRVRAFHVERTGEDGQTCAPNRLAR